MSNPDVISRQIATLRAYKANGRKFRTTARALGISASALKERFQYIPKDLYDRIMNEPVLVPANLSAATYTKHQQAPAVTHVGLTPAGFTLGGTFTDTTSVPAVVRGTVRATLQAENEGALRTALKTVKAERDKAVADLQTAQENFNVALSLGTPSKVVIPDYRPSTATGMPWLVLSDLHLEEVVTPDSIQGCVNEYNPAVSKRRLQSVFQHGLYMANTIGSMAKVDTMGLAILGDLISGYIHPDLVESNAMSPLEAIMFAQDELIAGINYLLKNSKWKLKIPCTHGNHGRTTEKMRTQTSAENSYEWMLYESMRKHFAGNDRVEFMITKGYHQYVKVWDTVLRFHHGDAIKYGGGVGGITIPVNKLITKWNTYTVADLDIFGHWHQYFDGGNFISNGSLIGPSAYAVKNGFKYERPRQAFFWVDSKMGKTLSAEVFVE